MSVRFISIPGNSAHAPVAEWLSMQLLQKAELQNQNESSDGYIDKDIDRRLMDNVCISNKNKHVHKMN